MSEPQAEDRPQDLPGLDPDQFVGEPPAGDANPDEFMSNDQSTSTPEDTGEDTPERTPEGTENGTDDETSEDPQ